LRPQFSFLCGHRRSSDTVELGQQRGKNISVIRHNAYEHTPWLKGFQLLCAME